MAIFFYSSSQKKKNKKVSWKVNGAIVAMTLILLGFGGFEMYQAATAPDRQCTTSHVPTTPPPASLTTAVDYFIQGDHDYESGNCKQAILDYTKSIELNPSYPETYNNRAYTYMRMQDYQAALADLEKAIKLNPDYIQALMNRGDIHNFYVIERQNAIADYNKVISLGGKHGTSVCSHLFLSKHNGWNLQTILDLPKAWQCPQTAVSQTTEASTVPLPQEEDIVRNFINLISEGNISEAVNMLTPKTIADDSQKQAWGMQLAAFKKISLKKIEPAGNNLYRVTLDVEMKPESAQGPIPYYGYGNGENVRWIGLEKVDGYWKITGIATGP